ncbi:MAG: radical SAM protein [Chitinispirillaceae bacterium]|nr:radical SAM protein [Chitinispirillaceae bacterium]
MQKSAFLKYAFHKRRVLPIYLIFGVTDRCNSRCLTCFNWRLTDTHVGELSLDDIEKTVSSMPHALLTLVLTGGEVFLRPELPAIIKIFQKYTDPQFLAIPTNGIQYREIAETVQRIVAEFRNNVAINLSLDGIGDLHDTIRGVKGNFDKIEKLYALLAEMKKNHPNLSLGVNTVLNNLNQDRYEEIFRYVRNNFPMIDQHNFEIMRGSYRDTALSPPSVDFLKEHTPRMQRLLGVYEYHKAGVYQRFLRAAKVHYHSVVLDHLLKRRALPCFGGSLAGVIDSKGDVFPCELLDKIGNIKDYACDFPSLWFSREADAVRRKIKETKCVCTHSCFQFVNILFNPLEYPRFLGGVLVPGGKR